MGGRRGHHRHAVLCIRFFHRGNSDIRRRQTLTCGKLPVTIRSLPARRIHQLIDLDKTLLQTPQVNVTYSQKLGRVLGVVLIRRWHKQFVIEFSVTFLLFLVVSHTIRSSASVFGAVSLCLFLPLQAFALLTVLIEVNEITHSTAACFRSIRDVGFSLSESKCGRKPCNGARPETDAESMTASVVTR